MSKAPQHLPAGQVKPPPCPPEKNNLTNIVKHLKLTKLNPSEKKEPTMTNLIAYHNDPSIKNAVIAEMAGHKAADRLVQGYGYWKDGKGCAVGCLIKSNDHSEYETRFGIPRALAYLEDRIFEGLPVKEAQEWPEKFLGAIKVGSDLSLITARLMYWLMTDPEGIVKYALPADVVVISVIAALYQRKINGDEPTPKEWLAARDEAYKVRRNAASAAYAASAAAYAADAAAYAADAAAYAADAADADAYARKAYFQRIANKLIQLLSESSVS